MMRTATTATTATSVTTRVAISRESFKLSGPGLGGVARHPWTRAVGRRRNCLLPPSVVTTLPSASIRQPPTAPCPPTLLHLQAGRSRLRLRPQILSTLGMHIHPLLKVAQLTLLIHRSPTLFHFLLGVKHLALLAYHSSPLPRGLYLAPHIPGGLRWSPGDFPESTWSPGVFFLAGSTAKLTCIIHLEFTRTPGGLQMNHMESVESTCQIAMWILPGLNPGSIHQESRRSLFSSEFLLLIVIIKLFKKVAPARIEPKTIGIL